MDRSLKTRKLTRTLLTGAALFLSHTKTAYAGINIKDASFSTTFTDLDTGHLKITRTYDSRSTFNGLFGFGWCSNLDRTLVKNVSERQATTSIAIDSCGRRTIFAAIGAKPTRRWETSRTKDGYVDVDRGDFVHHGPDGREIARFSGTDGRLSALASERNQMVPILREPRGSLLRDAASGEGLRVRLEVDPLANKVLRIETTESPPRRASYDYDGEDLIKATTAWNNTYLFRYDSLHNLLEAHYPDRTFEQLTYDEDHDRLLSFRGRGGCIETYDVKITNVKPTERRQTSLAVKSCGDKEESRVGFQFDYKRTPSNTWRLTKLKLSRGGRVNEINYEKGGPR